MPLLKRSYIKISGLLFFFVGAVLMGLALFLPRLVDINAYRDDIIDSLQKSLNRKVSFAHGEFTMRIGPSFVFDTVTVKEQDGVADFITAKRITVHLAVLPLLEKKIVLRDVVLEESDLRFERDRNGKLNIDDLLKPGADSYQVQFKELQIKKGTVHWSDQAIRKEGFQVEAQNVNLVLDNLSRGHKGSFKINFDLPAKSGPSNQISLSGSAKLPPADKALSESDINGSIDIKQFDPGRFWPYYGTYIPFGNTGGRVDLASSFKGKLREFNAKGKLRLANVSVNWPTVFHHPVNPRQAQLDYDFKLAKNSIDMPSLLFSADGFKIKGSCRLQDILSSDLRITAKGVSEPFKLEGLRQWIPYGIIAKDAADYIEEHILGGVYTLETGSLDGLVSQIVHMEKGSNYNVLHIKGVVEKGIVSYGNKVPAFTNIKAGLEMLGKDFILSHASGNFGESPFHLEGKITDYPLTIPCQYPFQMDMVPKTPEVAWLARLAGANRLEFSGNSRLDLKGSGIVSAYKLTGDWDLKQAAYLFPGVVQKPASVQNHLVFSSTLGPRETQLNSLSYTLSPLNLSAKAQLTYGEQPHLEFEMQTNPFMMNESLPILLMWQSYHPHGKVQAQIKGSGNPEDFSAMDYSGTIALTGFALQPGATMKPVSNINGTVTFKGNSLETSSISVLYGSSLIRAKGKVRNFSNPEAEINLSCPEFFLRDISSTLLKPDASIHRMQAAIAVHDKDYTIRKFSGQLNSSNFNVTGSYHGGESPAADLSVTSTNLDIDDLLLFTSPTQTSGSGIRTDLKLKLAVDAGNYGKLLFTHLNLDLAADSGIFYMQELDTGLYGGKLIAKGRIAPGGAQGTRYDLNINLDRVDSERLLQALDISREVTGTLNMKGDITARGSTLAEIKKSALGNIKLRMEKGALRKFNVLSKLFSILNVAQLLKFQLPDMVQNGMPYTEIKGSLSVRDGIAATQDLFIRSDALNISVIGNTDIVKEDLNFTIGVQPLQTVDKIVNRIPVVGWVLTGKNTALVTAYFEAKGTWSDPHVTAINVKSMAKGALNIFRRVFELPVRLFTDTGEVLLGK